MSKEETTELTVTVTIPVKVYNLLERFAHFTGVSIEDLLLDQLEGDIRGFWQNDYFQEWARIAINRAGCSEYFHVKDC